MTNIGAVALSQDNQKIDHIVFVADSMASNPENGSKGDNTQKLFQIGNHILMGTGLLKPLVDTALKLRENPPTNSSEVAEATLRLNHNPNSKTAKPLHFILGGPDREGFALYHTITESGDEPIKAEPNWQFFDGSGLRHVASYAQNTYDAGQRLPPKDLADCFVMCFDYGKQGAKDVGVNDKLQFGIVSEAGASTIYNPDIDLVGMFQLEFLENMTGFPLNYKEKMTKKEEAEFAEKYKAAYNVMANIFNSLYVDLGKYSNAKRRFTHKTEEFANGDATIKDLQDEKNKRIAAHRMVHAGALAIKHRGIDNLLEYQRNFDARKADHEANARRYFESFKK